MENIKEEKFIISSSPHLLKRETTKNIIWMVFISLLPASIFGIYAFGYYAGLIILFSIAASALTEYIIIKIRKKQFTLTDGSACLTGLLIGLIMPPTVPLYIPIISAVFAIGLVKQAFGGLGENWANPAISARVFALLAWPKAMNTWSMPFVADSVTTATPMSSIKYALTDSSNLSSIPFSSDFFFNIFTGPLNLLKNVNSTDMSYFDLFFGFKGGCIGEISIFLLLIGTLYLIYRQIITLDIPLSFILTVVILTWIFGGLSYNKDFFQGDFLFQLLTGGLILGAFFMATDMVTTPVTIKGRIIFGIGCGIITMLIRLYSHLPDGVCLAILFMNMLTPAINRIILIKPFGLKNETENNE